ncbi:hypothetical protein [Streptomyces filamentosus]|uniref:hypothetical protein n=1 Tax=Streptomyces filamentosus TaxID=67294 RepID=UPI0033E13C1E
MSTSAEDEGEDGDEGEEGAAEEDDGAGDEGLPSEADPPVADALAGLCGVPPPPPDPPPDPPVRSVQPVTTSATAAAARTALRIADERFMVTPREKNCAHRDASRPPAVAHLGEQALIL